MIADIFFSFFGTETYCVLVANSNSHFLFKSKPCKKDVFTFQPSFCSASVGSPYHSDKSHLRFCILPKVGSSCMLKISLATLATSSREVCTPEAILIDIPGSVKQTVKAVLTSAFVQSSIYTKSLEILLSTKLGYLPFEQCVISVGISLSRSSQGP